MQQNSSYFRGTSGIDIDLRKVDINQCPTSPQEGDDQIDKNKKYNIFGGTDKCKPETTKVSVCCYTQVVISFIHISVFECNKCMDLLYIKHNKIKVELYISDEANMI